MRLTDGWHCVRVVTFTTRVEPIREDRGCSLRACFMVVLCRLLWTVCSIYAFSSVEENKPPNKKLSSSPATLPASGRAGFQPVVPLLVASFPREGARSALRPRCSMPASSESSSPPSPGPSLCTFSLSASLERDRFLLSSGRLQVFWTLSAELCSDRKKHNYSLRLEGNCEHLQSAFWFNTRLECLS